MPHILSTYPKNPVYGRKKNPAEAGFSAVGFGKIKITI
jgi:hypothetical protein